MRLHSTRPGAQLPPNGDKFLPTESFYSILSKPLPELPPLLRHQLIIFNFFKMVNM